MTKHLTLQGDWPHHPGTVAVMAMLAEGKHGAWFVGGCVRNDLLGQPVADIDITTDARPERVMELAEAAGIKAVPTGLAHGTVTLVAHGLPHEVTTLRRDVTTDGRRATVAFTTALAEDAARRDFTMNALYATADGTVLDPNGQGQADLAARRLCFIGSAPDRIREDYLRILRFFRFHAWYADPEGGLDAEGLAACAAGIDGLAQLSRERVTAEMLKLLAAPDPAPATAAMAQTGVLTALLPGANADMLTLLTGLEQATGAAPDPIRRLAALGGPDATQTLRLSNADAKRLALYRTELAATTAPGALGYHHGAHAAQDILLLRGLISERPPAPDEFTAATRGAQAEFPVVARDLMPEHSGPALGQRLKALEERWIASGFALSKSDLLRPQDPA